MRRFFNPLNSIFILYIASVLLIAFGFMQREFILPISALVGVYILHAPLEDTAVFFVRTIPFFVALPFTSYFDSFNLWRIISGLIFLKWFFKENIRGIIISHLTNFRKDPLNYMGKNTIVVAVCVIAAMSGFSLLAAEDVNAGLRRMIYFTNLSLIGFVIHALVKRREEFGKRLIKNLAIPGVMVMMFGFAQLASAYLMTFWDFAYFWALQVQKAWYGWEWANIAVNFNTWFAYFSQQLSLRMFSTFPDSHSFPSFLLLAVPPVLAMALARVVSAKDTFKEMIRTRSSPLIVLLPLIYLAMILSGTRGIWLASAGPIIFLPFLLHKIKEKKDKTIFKYLISYLTIFFLLFLIANPILTSDQFRLNKEDNALFRKRIKSILDLNEESNKGRIKIWKASLESIGKRPLLGVGIGNFPTVLKQEVDLARAGSSAHNLYLHIAAEIGLVGLFGALVFLWNVLKRAFQLFKKITDAFIKVYSVGIVISLIWLYLYVMTDPIIFDERVFLIFIANAGIIFGLLNFNNKKALTI